jgi:hypothetical protein
LISEALAEPDAKFDHLASSAFVMASQDVLASSTFNPKTWLFEAHLTSALTVA